jgi:predicted  nucleic acid-binding Zn-ribbon protein
MCRACGEFTTAFPDGDEWIPTERACPECGGTEFKDNESGRIVRSK